MTSSIAAETGTIGFLANLKRTQEAEDIEKKQVNNKPHEAIEILEVSTNIILRWEGKDRPENELFNIEELAQSFRDVGQQIPCIVRPLSQNEEQYELIVGERRWRAAKIADMPLKVIVQKLNDRMAALVQAIENEERVGLSDFAKGMSYAKKIEAGILRQKDLTDVLKISRQQVSRLLSFNRIPQKIFSLINDFRKVSARTSEEICRLSSKGEDYVNIILDLADQIRDGATGHRRLEIEISKRLKKESSKKTAGEKVISEDGRHLFTWRSDNNSNPSIHFPNDIALLIKSGRLEACTITNGIKSSILTSLEKLSNLSPRGDKTERGDN